MEEPCVYEDMSGKEFVSFTASIYGVNKETFETRYEELVSKFDMKNDMNKLITFDWVRYYNCQRVDRLYERL